MRRLTTIKNKLLKLSKMPQICFYCGEPAQDREHVVPKSLVGENTTKVWSCKECNVLASDNCFDSIEDKRDFIYEKIRHRYKKVLKCPDWKMEDIEELGANLRSIVIAELEAKKWVTKRLNWLMSENALAVVCLLDLKDTGNDSALTNAEIDLIRKSGLKLSVSLD